MKVLEAKPNLEHFERTVNSTFENFRTAPNYPLEYHYAKVLECHLKDKEHPFRELISRYLNAQKLLATAYLHLNEARRLPKEAQGEKGYHIAKAEKYITQAVQALSDANLTYTQLYKYCLRTLCELNAMEGVSSIKKLKI